MQVSIVNPGDKNAPPKSFTFDGVYYMDSITENIYKDMAYPLVEGTLEGYNGTIFAYGQTGCGKSFSMQGIKDPPTQVGLIPRAFEHIFDVTTTSEDSKFLVSGWARVAVCRVSQGAWWLACHQVVGARG